MGASRRRLYSGNGQFGHERPLTRQPRNGLNWSRAAGRQRAL